MRAVAATLAATAATLVLAPAASAATPPEVRHLVAFRSGTTHQSSVTASPTVVRVRGRRCGVAAGTALAALVRREPMVRLRDFGSCSRRRRDAGGLFVSAIGSEANFQRSGWVYKVNNRLATTGAADPSGPFGRGRIRDGSKITWLYCRYRRGGCQRTLDVRLVPTPGLLTVQVLSYDDRGRAQLVAGASVKGLSSPPARTGPDGLVRFPSSSSSQYNVWASLPGAVRSHTETAVVP